MNKRSITYQCIDNKNTQMDNQIEFKYQIYIKSIKIMVLINNTITMKLMHGGTAGLQLEWLIYQYILAS